MVARGESGAGWGGGVGGGAINWETGIDIYIPLYIR